MLRNLRPQSRSASVEALVPVHAITGDGLLVREDGALVRYLDVVPNNPLALDTAGCERLTDGLTDLINIIPSGMSVQCHVQATRVELEDLIAAHQAEVSAVGQRHPAATRDALARLAECHEESLRDHAAASSALDVRYVLVVPFTPPDVPTASRGAAAHDRFARESLRLLDRLRSSLTGLDMKASALDGPAVADLLWRRLSPSRSASTAPSRVPGIIGPLVSATDAAGAALSSARLRHTLAQDTVDSTDRRYLHLGGAVEQTIFINKAPERTFYGWLLHAMQSDLPWTLSVHVHARDRRLDREKENRRARRLWGVNEGSLDRRARPDRQQHDQQQELEQLVDELSTGAQRLTDVAIYHTLRAPSVTHLTEGIVAARHDLTAVVDAGSSAGDARQLDLWLSSLPLGLDVAKATVRMIGRNAADSLPFVSTRCGSPRGVPLGIAEPGRTVELIDPFDRTHDNSTTLVMGKSGSGKTTTVIKLGGSVIPRGCQVNVIDRSTGHYRFLADSIPGALYLELGDESAPAAVNPWDVEDPMNVPRSKVAFLVRLHALLVGDHDAGVDTYGLAALERNLLAVAIRRVYDTAALPGESALHSELLALATAEADADTASVYRNLAYRLSEYTSDGTYGYLFDRQSTVAAKEAPILVVNTNKVPEDVSVPVLFAALEFITQRVERRHEDHQRSLAEGRTPAGLFDGTSALIAEELWKLLQRRATAAWVIELAKRSRHILLWLIVVTQQWADLDNDYGHALSDNSTIAIYLRNSPGDLARLEASDRLVAEEVGIIRRLRTEKGSHAEAYCVNGDRGRTALSISNGERIYWQSTSDPVIDLPLRNLAFSQTGGDHFATLDLLADPGWHAKYARAA